MKGLIVVKVGGSLYDIPDLGRHLYTYRQTLIGPGVLVVPGGGMTADLVRTFDQTHHLGEQSSHDLALRALTLNAHFLAQLVSPFATWPVVNPMSQGPRDGVFILDAHAFCSADRGIRPLPASWDATSDSVAARAAVVFAAEKLILLKSVSKPSGSWQNAVRKGIVDPLFVTTLSQGLKRMPSSPEVQLVNFRQYLGVDQG